MSFYISLSSPEQIRTFVALASRQPFEILVSNHRQHISAKHLMGMFSLDYSRPLQVHANCSADQFDAFRQDALALQN